MAPVVASDILQVSMLGRWTNGQPVVNVLHFRIDAEFGTVEVGNQVNDIVQNWQSQVLPEIRNNYTFEGARWMDLRSLDGATGFTPPDPGEAVVGGSTGEATSPGVSILVHKNMEGTRTTRSGRMYLPPPGEGAIDEDGRVAAETITAIENRLETFLENTTQGGIGEDTNRYLVVLHQDGTHHRVTSLTVDPVVASQRRRQR